MTELNSPSPTGGKSFLRRHRVLLLMTSWGIVIAGILHAEPLLAALFGSGHSICGVWGCGPPLSSLLVWHGFIAALAIPTAVWAAVCAPAAAQRRGLWVLAFSGTAATVFVVVNTSLWWQTTSEFARGFVVQRSLFAILAFTDAPIVPLLTGAAVYWWMGRRQPISDARMSVADHNGRAGTEQLEDFGDVVVTEVNAAT